MHAPSNVGSFVFTVRLKITPRLVTSYYILKICLEIQLMLDIRLCSLHFAGTLSIGVPELGALTTYTNL